MEWRLKELLTEKNAFALPNLLSLSRLVFIGLVLFFISQDNAKADWIALFFIILGASTDFFDGLIARRYHLQSNLGRILDPVLDKLGIGLVMAFLVLYKSLPLWYFLLIIGRDIAILVAGIYIIRKRHIITESNLVGKYTVGIYLLVIIFSLFNLTPYQQIALGLSLILLFVSGIYYGRIFFRVWQDK